MSASRSAVIRDLAAPGRDLRTCHKKAERPYPGGTQPRRSGLGQIWVIFGKDYEFTIGRIRAFSAGCMKTLEIDSMAVSRSLKNRFRNWPETGRKWAYFELLLAGPGVVLV